MRARRLLIIGLSLVLASCALVRGGPEFGPEQAQFVVEPGLGSGPEAQELGGDVLSDARVDFEEGTIEHLGSVSTPGGRIDFLSFESRGEQGEVLRCEGRFSGLGGGWGCGPVGEDFYPWPPDGDDLALGGSGGGGEWSEADFLVSPRVVRLTALAQDGTGYSLRPLNGRAFVMWPTRRGNVVVSAFNADGEVLDTERIPVSP